MLRAFFAVSNKSPAVTVGIVRAIVSLAENSDEKLRYLLLETLAELVILDLDLLRQAEGLRVVLQAFIEGPFELSPHLALAFLPIMDMPETRKLLRPGLDIEVGPSSPALPESSLKCRCSW
jgi:large subunit ribosomal protein L17e